MKNLHIQNKKNGVLVVISGPSGVGKGTVVSLLRSSSEFGVSVSATTRKPRTGEVDGCDYYFFSQSDFESKLNNGEFLEYTEYCGNYYGSLKSDIENRVSKYKFLILEIEIDGFKKLKKIFRESKMFRFTSIFIMPPSLDELRKRLENRGKDDIGTIEKRCAKSKQELEHSGMYDFVVVNDSPDACATKIRKYLLDFDRV